MQMTLWQGLVTIAAAAAGTMLTRFLPFLLFPDGKPLPSFIRYLGAVLPGASIKDIAPTLADLLGAKPAREWEGRSLLKREN